MMNNNFRTAEQINQDEREVWKNTHARAHQQGSWDTAGKLADEALANYRAAFEKKPAISERILDAYAKAVVELRNFIGYRDTTIRLQGAAIDDYCKEIVDGNKKNACLHQTIGELEKRRDELLAARDRKNEVIGELEDRNDRQATTIADYQKQIDALKRAGGSAGKTEVPGTASQVYTLHQRIAEKIDTIVELRDQLEDVGAKLAVAQSTIVGRDYTIRCLRACRDARGQTISRLNEQIAAQEKIIADKLVDTVLCRG
jgi:chromosome segregation ATPase